MWSFSENEAIEIDLRLNDINAPGYQVTRKWGKREGNEISEKRQEHMFQIDEHVV
jgi:hypothetical protein